MIALTFTFNKNPSVFFYLYKASVRQHINTFATSFLLKQANMMHVNNGKSKSSFTQANSCIQPIRRQALGTSYIVSISQRKLWKKNHRKYLKYHQLQVEIYFSVQPHFLQLSSKVCENETTWIFPRKVKTNELSDDNEYILLPKNIC